MNLDIKDFRAYCGSDFVVYSKHFIDRCRQRNIMLNDTENAILTGEIIEKYLDDSPFPSCLILGVSLADEKLHVVCAIGDNHLYMITAYRPSLDKWQSDFKTRRKDE